MDSSQAGEAGKWTHHKQRRQGSGLITSRGGREVDVSHKRSKKAPRGGTNKIKQLCAIHYIHYHKQNKSSTSSQAYAQSLSASEQELSDGEHPCSFHYIHYHKQNKSSTSSQAYAQSLSASEQVAPLSMSSSPP